ncbi:hypothetical protein QCA50_001188 [Cerrena zonata]|uniref:Uncharacterized protein n=1 Tax=Cerrena zonata TaxID=2478898 RepID=A0AAW0GYR0_9APHY
MSALVSLSDNPKNYQGGYFHLISLGVYVVLGEIDVFYFSGHHLHGGIAPEGEEHIEDWAYRCVIIFYPASKIISGSSQVFMAGSGICGEPVTLPCEVFSYDPPRPFTNHTNFFIDGAQFNEEKDHFTTSMHMLTLYIHHLLRQLPYEVYFDTTMFAEYISAIIDNSKYTSAPWKHAPASVINKDHIPEPSTLLPNENRIHYPPSIQYPSRQLILDRFVNELYFPSTRVLPHTAMDGIINRMPVNLRPTDSTVDINILRPFKTGKSSATTQVTSVNVTAQKKKAGIVN